MGCKYALTYIGLYVLIRFRRVQAVQNAHNTSQFWAEQQNKINIDRQKLELQAAAQKLEMQELDILERRRALQGT